SLVPPRPCRRGSPPGRCLSSRVAIVFPAARVSYIYYRRSLWIMLPAALLVSFSRIYNGVHYPSDVLVGAILGAGYAAASVWALEHIWQALGKKWFPLWWQRMPSLIQCRNPGGDLNTQLDIDGGMKSVLPENERAEVTRIKNPPTQ